MASEVKSFQKGIKSDTNGNHIYSERHQNGANGHYNGSNGISPVNGANSVGEVANSM